MLRLAIFAIDLFAVALLVFGLYFRRHRRRDLVAAYLGVNVGVLAVASLLTSSNAGVGLGLGLFGVLSIIRLRSNELDQHEVAYYFCALALGILGPLGGSSVLFVAGLTVLILAVMYFGDHPRLFRSYRRQVVVLDSAAIHSDSLVFHLERLLGARVHSAKVERIDLVNDTTVVEVRYSHQSQTGAATLPRSVQPGVHR